MYVANGQYIISLLQKYGPLTQRQLELLCQSESELVFRNTINTLRHRRVITDINGGYYLGLSKMDKANENVIRALWVLLYFAKDVNPLQHRTGDYPGQVFFLKGDCQYQIMVVHDRLEHEISMLPPKHPKENKKYIFIVSDFNRESYIEPYLPKNAVCLLATVSQDGMSDPIVRFKVPESQKEGLKNA